MWNYSEYLQTHSDKRDAYLQSIDIGQNVWMTQGLHSLESSLGQLCLLLCPLSQLVHEHRHRLSGGLTEQLEAQLATYHTKHQILLYYVLVIGIIKKKS